MSPLTIPAQPAGLFSGDLRTVFGVSGNVPGDWLAAQEDLIILLKDGYNFFKANRIMFTGRFADPAKTTTILINHPGTPFLKAIADKDYYKTDESQRSDFMQTVLMIQNIAATVRQTGVRPRVTFLGYRDVPTENIFLGDAQAIRKYYPTESYRGPLDGEVIDATQSAEARAKFNRAALTCRKLADGFTEIVNNETKSRPSARPLMNFKVPAKYRTKDFRL